MRARCTLHRETVSEVYAYVGGNPVSLRDPLGLWSITAAVYIGPGVEITIGSDAGRAFLTGRVGIGIGVGVGFDLNGKIPGPDVSESCRGGIVLGASVKGDLRSGPFDVGAELGAARNYTLSQSELVNEFNGQLQAPWEGVEAAISVGGQVTLYQGKH